jgi:hypothetical protein
MDPNDAILNSIFANFNSLEKLNLRVFDFFHITKGFYRQRNPNKNLKTFKFFFRSGNHEMIVRRFIEDFPNLEHLKIDLYGGHQKVVEDIVASLKKLKKLDFGYGGFGNFQKILMKRGRHLEYVKMDLNAIEDVRTMLEGKSLDFDHVLRNHHVVVRKEDKIEVKLHLAMVSFDFFGIKF